LIIFGIWEKNSIAGLLLTTTVVWSAIYSIWMFNRLCFGSFKSSYLSLSTAHLLKFNFSQISIIFVLTGLMWIFGITSDCILTSNLNLDALLNIYF
jgi:NADH-ubiquinone oxidoreductase chain 4